MGGPITLVSISSDVFQDGGVGERRGRRDDEDHEEKTAHDAAVKGATGPATARRGGFIAVP